MKYISLCCLLFCAVSAPALTVRPIAGIVGADTVWLDDFMREVSHRREYHSLISERSLSDVINDVWNDAVEERLVRAELAVRGVRISNADIDRMLIENPPSFVHGAFADDKGRFDAAMFIGYLLRPDSVVNQLPKARRKTAYAEITSFTADVRQRYRVITERDSLRSLVRNSLSVDTVGLREWFVNEKTVAVADLLFLPCASFAAQPDDDDLRAWYNDRANEYVTPLPLRRFIFTRFALLPTASDSVAHRRQVISFIEQCRQQNRQSSRDSLFRSVALYTDTAVQYVVKGSRDPFAALLTKARAGDVVGPVEVDSGFFIARVNSFATKEAVTTVMLTSVFMPYTPYKETVDSVYSIALQFISTYENGVELREALRRFGQGAALSEWVSWSQPVFNSWRMRDAVFDIPIGAISDPVDIAGMGLVVAVPVDSLEPGPLPFEAAHEMIRQDVLFDLSCDERRRYVDGVNATLAASSDGQLFIAERPRDAVIIRGASVTLNGTIADSISDSRFARWLIRKAPLLEVFEPRKGERGWYLGMLKHVSVPQYDDFPQFVEEKLLEFMTEKAEVNMNEILYNRRRNTEIYDVRWHHLRY